MLQRNTCSRKSTSYGLDCRTQVILEICIQYTGDCSPRACSAPKLPLVYYKRVSITFPEYGCVRNFFGLDEVWLQCSLSWFLAGGSGTMFHLQKQLFLESHYLLLQSVLKILAGINTILSILQSVGVAHTLQTLI